METVFIEATNRELRREDISGINHGKFMVGRFSQDEWSRPCWVDLEFSGRRRSLLGRNGWVGEELLVVDLQTGEGAMFRPGGSASADLNKKAIWTCPLFEPFLAWLYTQDLTDLRALPNRIEVLSESAFAVPRRPGRR